jgi:sugar lactone lactonase YvrE
MKTPSFRLRPGIILLLSTLFCLAASAKDVPSVDQVTAKDGVTMIPQGQTYVALDQEINLTSSIKVSTNATFTVNGGKPRKLEDGAILAKNGMLTTTDGKTSPVVDHITMKNGQLLVYKDGAASPLTRDYVFPNGTRLSPDGTIRTRNGRLVRMIEGQIMELSGESIPAKDTVTLRDGTVYVQKEGSQFKVDSNRSIMMNDGTKVFGDGTVLKRNGERINLSEGQILTLPGVTHR